MPIYEYQCQACDKRSSALLTSYASPDPACPECGKPSLRRRVSTFATVSSSEGDSGNDFGQGGGDDMSGGDDMGGGDDFGGGGDFGGGDDDY